MKTALHRLCIALATLILHSCSPAPAYATAPLTLKYTSETSTAQPYRTTIWQGETVDLQATLKIYGAAVTLPSNATATLWYQTNGMANAWWQGTATATTGGVLTAHWTPALDVGAASYTFYIGVTDSATQTLYRSHGQIKMMRSPGFSPNALDLPARLLDFSALTVSNAPWATPADVAAVTKESIGLGNVTNAAPPDMVADVARLDKPTGSSVWPSLDYDTNITLDLTLASIRKSLDAWRVFYENRLGYYDQVAPVVVTEATTRIVPAYMRGPLGWGATNPPRRIYTIAAEMDTEIQIDCSGLLLSASSSAQFETWLTVADPTNTVTWAAYGTETIVNAPNCDTTEANETIRTRWRAWKVGETTYIYGEPRTASLDQIAPLATTNWVNSIRGVFPDIATNVVYHVVVSNGHWLIQED